MTFELLSKIIEENNIPKDVKLMSDSGWEVSETEMNGIFYNRERNSLIFTQKGENCDSWYKKDDWICIYGKMKDFRDAHGYEYYQCFNFGCVSNLDETCFRSDREN